jgi:hypothetical protein
MESDLAGISLNATVLTTSSGALLKGLESLQGWLLVFRFLCQMQYRSLAYGIFAGTLPGDKRWISMSPLY